MASMVIALAAVLVALGLALALLAARSQRRHLAEPPLRSVTAPFVSILKPLKGADCDLEQNLSSFFRLDYPSYEVVLAVQDVRDPAREVAERVRAAHPHVPSRVVVVTGRVGLNPKVNNLAGATDAALHEILLVSDSNVRVEPGYLSDMVARLERPGVGLVSSLIRGSAARSLGSRLERLQLDTFVMGGISALARTFEAPAVVGKSMMLRRRDLERIGGWRFLGQYLAEDQVCGEEIARLGLGLDVSGRPVDNVLGAPSTLDFARRHLRWARIRRQMSPLGYAGEALLNPFPMALAVALATRTWEAFLLASLALVAMAVLALRAQRILGTRIGVAETLVLEAARSLIVALLWPLAFVSSRVSWRGNALRIGPRSRLLPLGRLPVPQPVDHGADGVVAIGAHS